MKYIKKFESDKLKYNVGDYVLIKGDYFYNKKSQCAKIDILDKTDKGYYLTILTTDKEMWIREDMIIRKLSIEEVEQFKLENDVNKYNL